MKSSDKTLINYILDFLEYCEKENNYSIKTIENYTRGLNRFIYWLKESNLSTLSPERLTFDHIKDYKEYLAGINIKNATQNLYLTSLRMFILYLAEKHLTPLLPEKIKLTKPEKRKAKDILTPTQLEKLLKAPDTSHNIGLRDRAILETISSTGLKVAELTAINKNSIKIDHFTNRAVIELSDKRGNLRLVYVPDKTTEWLIKYLNNRKDNDKALFINYRNRKENYSLPIRLTVRSIERIVKKYGNAIGFPYPMTPEILRNAYIKSVLENEPGEIKIIYSHQNLIAKKYLPNALLKTEAHKINKTDWNIIENHIKQETLWLKNNIDTLPEGYRSKDILMTCEECILRKLAILIVSSKIKAKKIKFEQLPWEDNSDQNENHRHGEEWHRKMMNAVSGYFKVKNFNVALEPILNFGRADLGIFSDSLGSPIYVEIGTTSLYKLLYNLLTMKNSIFLIIPAEEYMIEFRT